MRYPQRILPLATVLAALGTAPLAAQEAAPTPGVVVSMQQCNPASLQMMRTEFEQYWAPVLRRAVTDGRLLDWGLMEHFWGDEYNQVIYYVTPDVMTAVQTASAVLGEVIAASPGNVMEDFGERCTAHKDNIYRLVMSGGSEAAAAGGAAVPLPLGVNLKTTAKESGGR